MDSTASERAPSLAPAISLRCPVFALIIGIDEYEMSDTPNQTPRTLHGCVNDSNDFCSFLAHLGVPENHIKTLQNKEATRDAILEAFNTHFIRNGAIQRNDSIILYFAGHGGQQRAPANMYAEDQCVETFCPFDVVSKGGIPDYTLSYKLGELVGRRGNNIVAIFDSCHSGGMARAEDSESESLKYLRCYDPSEPLPPLPQDLPGTTSREGAPPRTIYDPDEAFVLLAACHAQESALEVVYKNRTSGAFTNALLASLSSWNNSVNGSLTYVRLIENLQDRIRNQTPHCEGKNRVRILFSPSDEGRDDPAAFAVTSAKSGRYNVSAGSIHGVVKGTEFVSQPPEGHSPVRLVVEIVEEFRSEVAPDPPLPHSILPLHSRAKVSKLNVKWLKVELIPRDAFPDDLEPENTLFTLAAPPALRLKLGSDSRIRVERTHPLLQYVENASDPRLIMDQDKITDRDKITAFIDQIAHFDFFLHSQPFDGLNISVSLHLVRKGKDNIYLPVDEEDKAFPNLFQPVQSHKLHEAYEAVLLASNNRDSVYGLTITNDSQMDLFPYVFFLDPFCYTVEKLYLPSSAAYPSLKRGSKFHLGYGTHAKPWRFTEVPAGLPQDSGFLKVFVSRTHINMNDFETARHGRLAKQVADSFAKCWASWIHVITVKRDP